MSKKRVRYRKGSAISSNAHSCRRPRATQRHEERTDPAYGRAEFSASIEHMRYRIPRGLAGRRWTGASRLKPIRTAPSSAR